jgi:hypothetical protein
LSRKQSGAESEQNHQHQQPGSDHRSPKYGNSMKLSPSKTDNG